MVHRRKTRKSALLLAILLLVTCLTATAADAAGATTALGVGAGRFTRMSGWARTEIDAALSVGLIPERLAGADLTQPATREELCEICILLYESLSGTAAEPMAPNPFSDTANPALLKAVRLGITTGTSASTFSPAASSTREQVATMFARTLLALFPSGDYSTTGAPAFSDERQISGYALNHVRFMSLKGILKGANGVFMPRPVTDEQRRTHYGTTRREEAVSIARRIQAGWQGTPTASAQTAAASAEALRADMLEQAKTLVTAAALPTDEERFAAIDFDHRAFRPKYDPPLTLKVTDGLSGTYSSVPYATVIRSNGSGIGTFQCTLNLQILARAAQIVWQVSSVPFDGAPVVGAERPGGLLMSGNLSKSTDTFDINFAQVRLADETRRHPNAAGQFAGAFRIPGTTLTGTSLTAQDLAPRVYYVRAFPADASGASLGDAGAGLPVYYGTPNTEPEPSQPAFLQSGRTGTLLGRTGIGSVLDGISLGSGDFKLLMASAAGELVTGGEFRTKFIEKDSVSLTVPMNFYVNPAGFPADTRELRLQVCLSTNDTTQQSWRDPSGLVYETSLFSNEPRFVALSGTASPGLCVALPAFAPPISDLAGKKLTYHVRVVALAGSTGTSAPAATYSNTTTIVYGRDPASSAPISLGSAQFDPYLPQIVKTTYTPIRWEAKDWQYHYVVIRQPTMKELFHLDSMGDGPVPFLPVGTKIDLTPKPEDKSWLEEVFDAVTQFFSDLVGFLKNLANWVSKAYANLKTGLVSFVANSLPLPDSLRGPFKMALTAMVDYGLASIGLPPSLPNFDELTGMGTDYLASVALEQAGLPVSADTIQMTKDAATGIAGAVTDATKDSTPNPKGWDFIKQDPDYLLKPASLMVEVTNPYSVPTRPAMLSSLVKGRIDMTQVASDYNLSQLYAWCGTSDLTLYKPVAGQAVPSLAPGQTLAIPVFLEELVGVPFPHGTVPIDKQNFSRMYYHAGDFTFKVAIGADLASPAEEAKAQSLPAGLYAWKYQFRCVEFATSPKNPYVCVESYSP